MIRKLLLGVTFIFIAGWWQISVAHTKAEVANEIKAVKAATAKYQDVNVALAEGFIPDPSGHCISAAAEGLPPEWGAMGIHYLNMAKLKITAAEPRVDGDGTHTDFTAPGVLLYEPQADGSLNWSAWKTWCSRKHGKQQAIINLQPLQAEPGIPWLIMQKP